MASLPTPLLSVERYLEMDRSAERPSEYYDGEVFAVENSTIRHSLIQINLFGALRQALTDKTCTVLGATVRVRIPLAPKYTYPDVVIVCGQLEMEDSKQDTLLNPVVILEILSPSTTGVDHGLKLKLYKTIPSLKEYILVAQDRIYLERYRRQNERQWLYDDVDETDGLLSIESIGCSIPLAEIYAKVEFDAPTQD